MVKLDKEEAAFLALLFEKIGTPPNLGPMGPTGLMVGQIYSKCKAEAKAAVKSEKKQAKAQKKKEVSSGKKRK